MITRIAGGGTERNIEASIAVELADGHSVTVLYGSADERFVRRISHQRVDMVQVPFLQRELSLAADVRAFRRLRRVLAGYDIVHTHQSKAGALGRLAAPASAVIVHTVHMASFGPGYGRVSSATYQLAERILGSRTDYLCFVGSELRDNYQKAGIKAKNDARVLRSAIEVDAFLSARGRPVAVDRPYLLAVGAVEPRKRYALMIHQLADLLRARDLELWIAGDGDRSVLEGDISSAGLAGRVKFLGHVSNVPDLMAGATALVHTSSAEGVSQALLQALIVGVRVIATQTEGLTEVDGGHITVASRDGSDLAAVVRSALDTPGRCAPPFAFQEWRSEEVARRYRHFVVEVVDVADHVKKLKSEADAA